MGFHTVWGQRLLKLSLVGVIGLLGFVPGLEKLSALSVLLVFLFIASLIEWLNRQRQAREAMPRHSWWQRTLHNVIIAFLLALPLRAWFVQSYVIKSDSMAPEILKVAMCWSGNSRASFRRQRHPGLASTAIKPGSGAW